jgi:hypothetical protein
MAKVRRKAVKKKAVKRKPVKRKSRKPVSKRKKRVVKKRKVVRAKRRTATRKRKSSGRKVVRQIQRTSMVRVIAGKKPKRRRARKRRVVMAGTRRRSVGKKGSSGLLIGLGIGAIAYLLLSRKTTTAYPNYPQLPPLTQTTNYQRNDQTNAIVNYALAAGLAVSAITALIDKLNNSDDSSVKNIYDHVETTGSIPDYVYV